MSGHPVTALEDWAEAANQKLNPKVRKAIWANAIAFLCGPLLKVDPRLLGLIVAAIIAGATGVEGTADQL